MTKLGVTSNIILALDKGLILKGLNKNISG